MVLIDFIFLVILGGFVLFGFWFGLVHTLGALVGTIAGVYLSSRWYDDVAIWAHNQFSGNLNVWNVVAFIMLFIVINRLIGFLFYLLEKSFDVLTSLPFLKSIDRFAGAFLGLIEGAVVLGGLIFIADKFPFDLEKKFLAASVLKGYFLDVFNILLPLVPQALKAVDKIIKQ